MPEAAIEIANCTPETNDKPNCPSFHYAAALCSHAAAIHLPAAITRTGAVQRLANASRVPEHCGVAAGFSEFQALTQWDKQDAVVSVRRTLSNTDCIKMFLIFDNT